MIWHGGDKELSETGERETLPGVVFEKTRTESWR